MTNCHGALLAALFVLSAATDAAAADVFAGESAAQEVAERVVHSSFNAGKVAGFRSETRSLVPSIIAVKREGRSFEKQRNELRKDTRDLDALLGKLNAEKTALGTSVNLPAAVLFAFDRADLRPDAEDTLDSLRQLIELSPGNAGVRIEGHTDSLGSEAYNLLLSQRRADSVAVWLRAHGISGARLKTVPLGESQPVDTNETDAGRQRNRRVVVIIEAPRAAGGG